MSDNLWLSDQFRAGIPPAPMPITDWAPKYVRLPGSAISEQFTLDAAPWLRDPLACRSDGVTQVCTFVKPVQCGGSVVGEAVLVYTIATATSGDIQYNWEDDTKALERWDKRIDRILRACHQVRERWPSDRHKAKRGMIMFPHLNLTVQGVWQPDNLDSDSICTQINEEIHNWEPGRLEKAYRRTTRFWNRFILNISNAGKIGDQLHQAWESGSQQHWEVRCPGCGGWHRMRTRWDDKAPHLGGLRYDADGCRRENGSYDYNRMAGTVRYQMPCGYEVPRDIIARRRLSESGRYSDPENLGAKANRSYTLDAVAVHDIDWLMLIEEKHKALRALRGGDPEPWRRYITERECSFWDPEERPVVGRIVLSDRKKDRDGLPEKVVRFGAADRQQGSMRTGDLPHWWVVIRDVDAAGNSLLVFEGRADTDDEMAEVFERHGVQPRCVALDSGWDTTNVYRLCLKHGFSAIKGSDTAMFSHEGGAKRIFSPERPLWQMLNLPGPVRDDGPDEPLFWHYSKHGIRERLAWLRSSQDVKWEVPCDVSEDYQRHMEAEEEEQRTHPRTGETVTVFVQVKKRNDLYVCECYIAMLMDMGGFIGVTP